MKKAREFWLLVGAAEVLAVGSFLAGWSAYADGVRSIYGFYFCFVFGGLALILRALAAREARFLRQARRVRAQISGIVLNPRGDARGTDRAEVEYRYWPEENESHESRTLIPRRRAERLSVGQVTAVYLAASGQAKLEAAIDYHRLGPKADKELSR